MLYRRNEYSSWRGVLVVAAWCGVFWASVCRGQIQLANDRPKAHSPEQSARLMRLRKGE